jgi:hypothetical protein
MSYRFEQKHASAVALGQMLPNVIHALADPTVVAHGN